MPASLMIRTAAPPRRGGVAARARRGRVAARARGAKVGHVAGLRGPSFSLPLPTFLPPGARSIQAGAATFAEVEPFEVDPQGRARLPYKEDGWNFYKWQGHRCHYIQDGDEGPPVVLVHGFGAHAYHWRYQFPELAKKHRVYAICLLGYGWSDKADLQYSGEIWGQQVADFIDEVVGEPAALVGNSIGAIACLNAATLNSDKITGLALLNAAGKFGEMQAEAEAEEDEDPAAKAARLDNPSSPVEQFKAWFERVLVTGIFYSTRVRIKPILSQVYHNRDQVDGPLVRSIQAPAEDPKALKAFMEISRASMRTKYTVNGLVDALPITTKILLLWGQQDPWMQPEKADIIQRVCDDKGLECKYVPLTAGHCPHDDEPEGANAALLEWLAEL